MAEIGSIKLFDNKKERLLGIFARYSADIEYVCRQQTQGYQQDDDMVSTTSNNASVIAAP